MLHNMYKHPFKMFFSFCHSLCLNCSLIFIQCPQLRLLLPPELFQRPQTAVSLTSRTTCISMPSMIFYVLICCELKTLRVAFWCAAIFFPLLIEPGPLKMCITVHINILWLLYTCSVTFKPELLDDDCKLSYISLISMLVHLGNSGL